MKVHIKRNLKFRKSHVMIEMVNMNMNIHMEININKNMNLDYIYAVMKMIKWGLSGRG